MTAKSNIGPRISIGAKGFYKERFSSLNAGAEYALEAFPVLYRRTLADLAGRFTAGELSVMLDVANGLALTPGIAGQHLVMECVDAMALDGLDSKWRVVTKDFLEKLQALSLFQCACLEVWARAYWESDYYQKDNSLAEYVKPLTAK
jgi:outer membrane scaffolding protein for murein synthesis (MipA/OmpV family)